MYLTIKGGKYLMKFNYFYEQKNFIAYWEKESNNMREAGMSEDKIQQMYDYDWDWFKSKRRFAKHNNTYGDFEKDENEMPFFLSKSDERLRDSLLELESFPLLDQIESYDLFRALQELKPADYKLLIQRCIEGIQVKELAKLHGCSSSNICVKLKKIHKQLKKYL